MNFSAKQIAELLHGKIEGKPDVEVNKLAKIEEGEPNSLSFLANPLYKKYLYTTDASIVILNKDFLLEKPVKETCTLIRVDNAYECFAQLLEVYDQFKHSKIGIEQPSFIAENAKVGKDVYIGAFTYLGENAKIGDNVKIYPNSFIGENVTIGDNAVINSGVKIYKDCVIGKNCIIHAGVCIGADGFGFVPKSDKNYKKMPQLGNVVLHEDVEIGANTCIDRATLGSTIIEKGVKIDNLVQIGHNAIIGENTVVVSQTGISGSSKIGSNCMIGGQVGIVGHIEIASGVKIAAQSGVGSTISEEEKIVQGSPAFDIGEYRRSLVGFKKLPEILKRLDVLENGQNG